MQKELKSAHSFFKNQTPNSKSLLFCHRLFNPLIKKEEEEEGEENRGIPFPTMERRLKHKISRLFRIPFLSSCRTRNLVSDVISQQPIFISHTDFNLLHPPSPSKPSFILSKATMASASENGEGEKRTKLSTCPPPPPASPLNSRLKSIQIEEERIAKRNEKSIKGAIPEKIRNERKKKDKKTATKKGKEKLKAAIPSTSSGDSHCFFSSEEEEEEGEAHERDALFSSKSFSSDSSFESHRRRRAARRRARKTKKGRRGSGNLSASSIPERDRVKGVAVVKRSSDPYGDFRSSMVEMIMEKQMFGVPELEQLLHCFLSLNLPYHHRVILEVFEEICEALFWNWS